MELNAISTEKIREYLIRNFISLQDLKAESLLNEVQIRDFIEHRCLPSPSYTITQTHEVYSNLSGKFETIAQLAEEFFPPSTVGWLLEIRHKAPSDELAAQLYRRFDADYQSSIINRSGGAFAFSERQARADWESCLKGIYGICIKGPISADSIVRKAIAVHRVSILTDNGSAASITGVSKSELISAMKEFDSIVSNFAPHDWKTSSRKRLFDDLVPRFGLQAEFPNFRIDPQKIRL